MNLNTINHCFKVSEIPLKFQNEKNQITTTIKDIYKYDLPNEDIYSLDGTLIELASKERYNSLFLHVLYYLSFDEVKDFLNYQYTFSTLKEEFLDFVKIGTIHSSILKDEPMLIEAIKKWIAEFDEYENLLNIENGLKFCLSEYYDDCLKNCFDQSQYKKIRYKYNGISIPVNHLKLNILFNADLYFKLNDCTNTQQIKVNKDILANAYFIGYKQGLVNFDKEYKPPIKQLYEPHFLRTIKTTLENELNNANLNLLIGLNPLGLKGWKIVKNNIPMVADKSVFYAFGYYQAHYDEAIELLNLANTDFNEKSNTSKIIETNPIKVYDEKLKNSIWFKTGLIMYEDENFHRSSNKIGVTPTLKNYYSDYYRARQYFDATIKDYRDKYKNLFLRNDGEDLSLLLQYCIDNNIMMCDSFRLILQAKKLAQ